MDNKEYYSNVDNQEKKFKILKKFTYSERYNIGKPESLEEVNKGVKIQTFATAFITGQSILMCLLANNVYSYLQTTNYLNETMLNCLKYYLYFIYAFNAQDIIKSAVDSISIYLEKYAFINGLNNAEENTYYESRGKNR